jgi:hypothetical protein
VPTLCGTALCYQLVLDVSVYMHMSCTQKCIALTGHATEIGRLWNLLWNLLGAASTCSMQHDVDTFVSGIVLRSLHIMLWQLGC